MIRVDNLQGVFMYVINLIMKTVKKEGKKKYQKPKVKVSDFEANLLLDIDFSKRQHGDMIAGFIS